MRNSKGEEFLVFSLENLTASPRHALTQTVKASRSRGSSSCACDGRGQERSALSLEIAVRCDMSAM